MIESPNRAAVTGMWAQPERKGAQRLADESVDSALAFRESLISFVNHVSVLAPVRSGSTPWPPTQEQPLIETQ